VFSKLESFRYQVLNGKGRFGDARRSMDHCLRQDMIQLVRHHPAQSATQQLLGGLPVQRPKLSLQETAHLLAIHIGERKDGPVTDVGRAQNGGVAYHGDLAIDTALALEMNYRQIDGNSAAAGIVERAPFGVQSHS